LRRIAGSTKRASGELGPGRQVISAALLPSFTYRSINGHDASISGVSVRSTRTGALKPSFASDR
jgi:hypothetical protein